MLSKSYITMLSEEEREGLTEEARKVVQKGEGKVWIDEAKGVFEYPYRTTLVSEPESCSVPVVLTDSFFLLCVGRSS